MLIVARILFWSAVVFALAMASVKHPPAIPGDPGDKLQHIVAFVTLSVLAAWAYPRLPPLAILIGLLAFGGFIELVQAIPGVDRDPDVRDWLADALAAAATLLAIALAQRLRRRLPERPRD